MTTKEHKYQSLPSACKALWLAFFCLFALLTAPLASGYSASYNITEKQESLKIDSRYYFFEDKQHQFSIDDILGWIDSPRWQQKDSSHLEWKYSNSVMWYRFDVNMKADYPLRYILEVASPFTDYIDFYHIAYDSFGEPYLYNYAAGGDQVDDKLKYLRSRNPVFPVDLAPDSKNTIVLRIKTSSAFIIPMNLFEETQYHESEGKAQAFLGMLFGFMLVMAIYNSVIWLFFKEKTFFFYVAYVLCALLYQMSLTGFGTRYLWGGWDWFVQNNISLIVSVSFMFGGLFVIHFLSLRANAPRLYYIAMTLVGIYGGFAVFSLFMPESYLVPLLQPLGMLASALVLYTGIYLWVRGSLWAKYLTISWTVLVIGTIVYTLMLIGVVERNAVTEYLQCFGFAIEVSLLSIALAARMNQERQAKRIAMETALDLAHRVNTVNQEKLIIERQANIELEQTVNRKTAELRHAMEELSYANRQLEQISVKDQLTGLYNRRFFDDYFPNQYRNCSLLGKPISVLVIDIDYFKKINDVHGHLAGDECLRTIAKVIASANQREDDKIVRYGGEEFMVVLPNTNAEGANRVAERIRSLVENTLFVANSKRIPLTISVGVAAIVPDGNQPPESIIKKADSALYEAKRSGRNCVKVAAS